MIHTPVLLREVLHYLDPQPGQRYIDATADGGGHASAIIPHLAPDGELLGLEWDEELFGVLQRRLKQECPDFSKNYILRRASFTSLAGIIGQLNFRPVSGILFDLGLSSFHIEASRRGFSFRRPEPLDMRFSRRDLRETAAELLNRKSIPELERILRTFGQERFAQRISRKIGELRLRRPFQLTTELVAAVGAATPRWYQRSRIHFATRTFQALRITVNHELENLTLGLRASTDALAPRGVLVTIAFHSLEERTIKEFFRAESKAGRLATIVEKPITPRPEEIRQNPRARSAKMRVFERR